MDKNTITFEIGGRVELKGFAEGIAAFQRLVNALTPRSSGVTWVVDDLQPGSAIATFRGEADNPAAVARIVSGYEQVGAAMASYSDLSEFDGKVVSAVRRIKALTRMTEYVRLETEAGDFTIYPNGHQPPAPALPTSIGAITGRIQTLSNRNGLRFNLYDTVHDKAVSCYLASGQEELIREAWGQRATVTGRVSREAVAGRPVAIRQIVDITTLAEPVPGSYRQARGAVPWQPDQPRPEDVIRRLRDA